MEAKLKLVMAALSAVLISNNACSQDEPEGYWSLEQANEILDKTRRVRLAPPLSALSAGEQAAAAKLIRLGRIMHRLYQDSMHPQALDSLQALQDAKLEPDHKQALLELNYLFKGPIASTLDNQRVPFLPVAAEEPGKNVYPAGTSRAQLDPVLEARPELAPGLLGLRTVVRESSDENLQTDLATLDRYPLLDGLHPGLREKLQKLLGGVDQEAWYALPYSVRWAPGIMESYDLLNGAAADVRDDDPDFADYLALRARDLVSDDYEGGDAAWVRGRFGNLNAQIGSYEVYGDALYGVKSLFSLSLLVRDEEKSRELTAAMQGLQAIQDSLPLGAGRKIQQDIPVGVYNVVADFGQSRGANTATILPNEAAQSRKYGRTILLRYNIMTHPDLFSDASKAFATAVAHGQAGDLTLEGPFTRTLWHEVGHYLGVDRSAKGADLNESLSPWGSHYEEMKADLVSLFTAAHLNREGLMSDQLLRSVYAGGILRVLQTNRPRSEQPYQTMQLMQMNYFLEQELLSFDESSGRLTIHYDRYAAVASKMLAEVLAIQAAGDSDRAAAFIEQYTAWTPELHERLAARLRDSAEYRYRMVEYRALQ
jgi:hypothetical protein